MDFDKLREKQKEPFTHPKVEIGFTRIRFEEIGSSTDKALLVILANNRKIWIPKSVSKYRYGNSTRGVAEDDKNDVIDVENWFYEQSINI